jgi:3-deoxy-D-manno-octulosonate 8-phosphate phosphatase (KDO 8-P phosphatase)
MVTPMHSALGWLHRNGFGACLSLAERARCIRLLLTDCDGVLTDGTVYYSAEGEALKRFHMRDGMGVERLRSAVEVDVGIISRDKQAVLAEIIARRGLALEQVAYIGDDVNDVTVMELVGLAACPADATPFARTAAHMICQTLGGAGVLREVAELIIAAHATPPSNGAARAVAPADAALAGLRATVRDQWRCFDERSEW